MSDLKPVYLVWGDDDAKLDEWRQRIRKRAGDEGPGTALEVLRDEGATADATVAAIASLTLSVGGRYVLVDGVERWREPDNKQVAGALAGIPDETIVVLLGRQKPGREVKPPVALAKAVEKAGGEVKVCIAPRGAEQMRSVFKRARDLGLELERDAIEALLERVPRDDRSRLRQQTLQRELEKLAIYAGDDRSLAADEVEALAGSASDARMYELADAVVERDTERALRLAEELRARGEDFMYILFALLRALRECYLAKAMLAAGKPVNEIQSALGVPGWKAKQIVGRARRADEEQLEHALEALAELDWDIRGSGRLDPDSSWTLTLVNATRTPQALEAG
jgi:DNA polymerase III subunit delta